MKGKPFIYFVAIILAGAVVILVATYRLMSQLAENEGRKRAFTVSQIYPHADVRYLEGVAPYSFYVQDTPSQTVLLVSFPSGEIALQNLGTFTPCTP